MAWLGWKRGFAISKILEKLKADSIGISQEELSEAIQGERESEKRGVVASHRGLFQIPSTQKYFFQHFPNADVPSNFIAYSTSGEVCDLYHPLPLPKIRKIAQWLLEEYRMNRRGAWLEVERIYPGYKGARVIRREQLDEHVLRAIVEIGFNTPFFFYSFYRGNKKTIELVISLRAKKMKRMSRYVMPYPSLIPCFSSSPHLGDD